MSRSHLFSLGLATAALALGLAAPTLAQDAAVPNPSPDKEAPVDRGYDKDTPKHEAVDAQEAPQTATLNKAVAAVGNEAQEINAENQAQYEADRAAYRAAVEAHARANMADAVRYERQQGAYADAMAAWRKQVQACKDGKKVQCEFPTPDPAAFY